MGLFAGLTEAQSRQSADYLRDGDYELEVKQIKVGKTRKKMDFFCAEFRVVSAAAGSKNPVGSTASHMIMLASDYAHSDIKAFVSAAMGIEFDRVDEKGVETIVGPQQPLRGKRVRCIAVTKPTKTGGEFTKLTYYSLAS